MSLAGKVKHFNGVATVTPATIAFGASSRSILIDNVDTTESLLVSFDKGTTFKTIAAGKSLSIDVVSANLIIKSNANTANYEILVTLG